MSGALELWRRYSFGLRQQLYTLLNGHPDQCKCADPGHLKKVQAANTCPPEGDKDGCLLVGGHSRNYIEDLQKSVFCVVLPGNGWGHIEEPVSVHDLPWPSTNLPHRGVGERP